MINKVILIGNLAKDPELRSSGTGTAVCNLVVATSDSWKDKEGKWQDKSQFHRIVVWGQTAERCAQSLKKGSRAYVEGSIDYREYTDKEGNKKYITDIKAYAVRSLEPKQPKNDAQAELSAADPVPDDILF